MRSGVIFVGLFVGVLNFMVPYSSGVPLQVGFHKSNIPNGLEESSDPKTCVYGILKALMILDYPDIILEAQKVIPELEGIATLTSKKINEVLQDAGQEIGPKVHSILEGSKDEAKVILKPLLDILRRLIPVINETKKDDVMDHAILDAIIKKLEEILGITLPQLRDLLQKTKVDLEDLVRKTIQEIQEVTSETGQETQEKIQDILDGARVDVEKALQSLVGSLKPVIEAIQECQDGGQGQEVEVKVPLPNSNCVIGILRALFKLDYPRIIYLGNEALPALQDLAKTTGEEINFILLQAGIDASPKIIQVLAEAGDEAQVIIKPLIDILRRLIPFTKSETQKDLSNPKILEEIIHKLEEILGLTLPQLKELVHKTQVQLGQLGERTIQKLRDVASDAGQEVQAKVQTLIEASVQEGKEIIDPLLELAQPLIDALETCQDQGSRVDPISPSLRAKCMFSILQALIKLDAPAILNEAKVVGPALTDLGETTIHSISDIVKETEGEVIPQIEGILINATAKAEKILQPLVDILNRVLGKELDLGQDPKGLPEIIQQVEQFLGITIPKLNALLIKTKEDLTELTHQVVEDILKVTGSAGEETSQKVQVVLNEASAQSQVILGPLFKLLKPLLDIFPCET